jgi:hypothetical protein
MKLTLCQIRTPIMTLESLLPPNAVRTFTLDFAPQTQLADLAPLRRALEAHGDRLSITRDGHLIATPAPADHIPATVRALFTTVGA